jgi:hypothetical protein
MSQVTARLELPDSPHSGASCLSELPKMLELADETRFTVGVALVSTLSGVN